MSTERPTIFDVSLRLTDDTLLYPGDPPPEIERVSDIARGDLLTASRLSVNCHVGTHVDAPAHFLADGETLDRLPLEAFYGPAVVLELAVPGERIERCHVEALSASPGRHLLLKTRNSSLLARSDFAEDYVWLTEDAAEFLVSLRPLSIGFDYYSLDAATSVDFPAHKVFARRGLPVFVCLDLARVPAGDYTFSGLPLALDGAEASPVRAVLVCREGRS